MISEEQSLKDEEDFSMVEDPPVVPVAPKAPCTPGCPGGDCGIGGSHSRAEVRWTKGKMELLPPVDPSVVIPYSSPG